MYEKEAALGAVAGLVILGGIVAGVTVYQEMQTSAAAQETIQAEPIENTRPTYSSTRAIFEKLHPACKSYRRTPPLGTELSAATCLVRDQQARIGLYEGQEDVEDALDASNGRGVYGHRLTILAGVNWTMSLPSKDWSSAVADQFAKELGGVVVFR